MMTSLFLLWTILSCACPALSISIVRNSKQIEETKTLSPEQDGPSGKPKYFFYQNQFNPSPEYDYASYYGQSFQNPFNLLMTPSNYNPQSTNAEYYNSLYQSLAAFYPYVVPQNTIVNSELGLSGSFEDPTMSTLPLYDFLAATSSSYEDLLKLLSWYKDRSTGVLNRDQPRRIVLILPVFMPIKDISDENATTDLPIASPAPPSATSSAGSTLSTIQEHATTTLAPTQTSSSSIPPTEAQTPAVQTTLQPSSPTVLSAGSTLSTTQQPATTILATAQTSSSSIPPTEAQTPAAQTTLQPSSSTISCAEEENQTA
ncbi:hypothetical protein ACOME3_007625 [Neoechinorhynchus agilis]